jgi:hypothetical protein
MPEQKNGDELLARMRAAFYAPVIGDILDACGR